MYKRLLIATDGTEIAQEALAHGLKLAKAVGTETTVITVTMPWTAVAFGIYAGTASKDTFDETALKHASALLSGASKQASDLGVPCKTLHVADINPYQAILAATEAEGSDLIVVGSHGRRGLERLLIGSETLKLLTHAKLPVLVWRG